MDTSSRLDDNESIFFSKELETVQAKVFEAVYPSIKARDLFPVDFDYDPTDETITFKTYSGFGMASIIHDYAKDFKNVGMLASPATAKVKSIGNAYQYTTLDIKRAARINRPLDASLAQVARRAQLQLENDIVWYGDAEHGLIGILNNPNVPDVALPTGNWNTATNDQIVADLNALAGTVQSTSQRAHVADTLLLPNKYLTKLATTARSANTDTTLLEFFMKANPTVRNIDWVPELDASLSGGKLSKDTAIAFERNPQNVHIAVPQEFEQLDDQREAMLIKVPCHARIGGAIITRPLAFAKTDDIGAP